MRTHSVLVYSELMYNNYEYVINYCTCIKGRSIGCAARPLTERGVLRAGRGGLDARRWRSEREAGGRVLLRVDRGGRGGRVVVRLRTTRAGARVRAASITRVQRAIDRM